MMRLTALVAAAVLLTGVGAEAAPVQRQVPVQVQTPLAAGKKSKFTFGLYAVATRGTPLWQEGPVALVVAGDKTISWTLGSKKPFGATVDFSQQLWLQVKGGGRTWRLPLRPGAYALWSERVATEPLDARYVRHGEAGAVSGGMIAEGAVTDGKIAGPIDTSKLEIGSLAGTVAAGDHTHAGMGDITSVNTPGGSGLSGGSGSGDVSLVVDTTAIQRRVAGVCDPGSSIRTVNEDGTVTCELDDAGAGGGTVTEVATGTGLTGGPINASGTIAIDTAVVPRLGAANTFTGAQAVQTGGAAAVGLTVLGATAQSANLQEWKDSAGATLAALGPSGTVTAAGFSGSGAGLTGVSAATLGGQAASAFAGATHAHSGADIASGTVATARLSLGAAAGTVAAGDHNHDATYVNEGQGGSVTSAMIAEGTIGLADLGQNGCGDGQLLKWNGAAWACAADADTDTGVNAVTNGGGITGSIAGRTLTLGSDATVQRRSVAPTCPDGQYLKGIAADGTPTCAADGTGTFAGWSVTGNAGTNPATNFIGTTDDVPFEVRVNNQRALRLERVAATVGANTWVGQNVVGGDAANSVTPGVTMATIAGGGGVAGGTPSPNRVTDVGGTVGGGWGNQAGDDAGTIDDRGLATVGGGGHNTASGGTATVSGGVSNHASGDYATVGGGLGNTAGGAHATVAGGQFNRAYGDNATVAGGWECAAGGTTSFAAGTYARVRRPVESRDIDGDEGTFVWADSSGYAFQSTGPNQFLVRAVGGVGINTNAPQAALHVAGDVMIDGSSQHDFSLRQKINLWGNKYGIGVQNNRQYFRADAGQGFAWFSGGSHNDTADDPGAGGALMMRLSNGGNLDVGGTLTKGGGSFKIDHPLDPRNRYLSHSFVESPDMMNIYNGNVTTDGRGYATVELPAWFGALNRNFRYQLTVVDEADGEGFVQAKVVRGVAENRFTIRTSAPGATVSWQVTGIRQDPYANAHRIPVEEEKQLAARGTCLHAEACGEQLAQGR